MFLKYARNLILFILLAHLLIACTSLGSHYYSPKTVSEFQQGQRFFEAGYYKQAMRMLLPLACDGMPEAQYAVGYMYYYGYGVCQDPVVGAIWIKRAAANGYAPAAHAAAIIKVDGPVLKTKKHGFR